MYIPRHMEETVRTVESMFGAVLITGPRQVGKTTLLRHAKPEISYRTLDDPLVLRIAANEPRTFLLETPPPLIIDEVQYAPGLFPYIKMSVDESGRKGQFFMSGSQQFHMMKNVTESLAGRVGVMDLLGLSLREIQGVPFTEPFIPTRSYLEQRKAHLKEMKYHDIWKLIHRGGMPELYSDPAGDWQMFYASYVRTYIERDVHDLTQVGDRAKFVSFMTAAAACTGSLLNLASLSRDVGISQPTADRWLSILQASQLVYLLQPYHNNVLNRAIKTPKIYFLDTGLAAYLTQWNTPEVLQNGNMAGAFFETFVVSEIIKSYYNKGRHAPIFFYRDKEKNEIDILIHQNGVLHPIEIKKHADPTPDDVAAFRLLNDNGAVQVGHGGVVCMHNAIYPLDSKNTIIPVQAL